MKTQRVVITSTTLEKYLEYQREERPWPIFRRLMILMAMGAVAFCGLHFGSFDSLRGLALQCIGGFSFAISVIYFLYFLAMLAYRPERELEDAFDLLDRWEKYTGRPVREFPISLAHVVGYVGWATRELCCLGIVTNLAFARQAELRKQKAELNLSSKQPGDIVMILSKCDEDIAVVDGYAKYHQGRFLGFWDLVTDKGIGILKGHEYRDPEKFRKSLPEEQSQPVTAT